ncbi:MAG: hypothetical protein HUJ22_06425 [Gracilimonas sp.]|uniref:hypothetical protein n=1 Tax=Gracilimonas sp. TaxID=1974203 RepID=UPI001998C10A|nr:hypothetical protein [Gracilimonas sp.]MBD3616194.1 hypothetical protein [Gracilimonas sp.]
MVKVYKTNVNESSRAQDILEDIRDLLPGSDPSFDLEDRDKVLRIERTSDKIEEQEIREILSNYGHSLEILL